ncbi:unnamed protein product [Adineta ricciae]|uniref:Uncharacterized protein n=1 Tax=Adineta ricciae TaxID=249248 RepID=A0A814RF41_ADIRI|nr:unnamed protein product [Adineta ricciae]CAF1287894.1 unnamed protein product [Adineta ricciae]
MKRAIVFLLLSIVFVYIRQDKAQRSITAGQRIIPVNSHYEGDIIEFVLRSNETGHTHSTIKQTIKRDGPCGNLLSNAHPLKRPCTPPIHYHLKQDEKFDIKQGRLGYILNGMNGTKETNESLFIPKSACHTFWSAGDDDLVVYITLYNDHGMVPGRSADSYFENINGVRRDSPSLIATLQVQIGHDIYRCDLPRLFNSMFSKLFQIVALALGYQIQYVEYTTPVI